MVRYWKGQWMNCFWHFLTFFEQVQAISYISVNCCILLTPGCLTYLASWTKVDHYSYQVLPVGPYILEEKWRKGKISLGLSIGSTYFLGLAWFSLLEWVSLFMSKMDFELFCPYWKVVFCGWIGVKTWFLILLKIYFWGSIVGWNAPFVECLRAIHKGFFKVGWFTFRIWFWNFVWIWFLSSRILMWGGEEGTYPIDHLLMILLMCSRI